MATGSMKDIKRRIKSVESTMQITKAMELVASSKLRKAKQRAEDSRPFFNALYEIMSEISAENSDFSSPYTQKRDVKKSLYIVIAGDRGLAGGYNSNVLRLAERDAEGKDVKILAIGKKAVEFFSKRDADILEGYAGIAETITSEETRVLSDIVTKQFLDREVDEVKLYFTEFVSTLNQKPRRLPVLPIARYSKKDANQRSLTSYDPSAEQVYEKIVPQYISGLIFGAVVESYASEQGARRVAMEAATDNANEMIDELSLLYNRARQASITQEISEIVSGAKGQG
ncbi:MAG: ATP synthase F1 subunit gamma [Clostridiales bacterium]|nr:ATP synthase F1 subunit gamma [Clostridiales bacterium]